MQKAALVLLLLISAQVVFAQDKKSKQVEQQDKATLYGTITDDQGKPIADAQVKLLTDTKGVASDANGSYKITVPSGQIKVVFSYLSLSADTVSFSLVAGERRVYNVKLAQTGYVLPIVEKYERTADDMLRDPGSTVRIPIEDANYLPSASGGDISTLLKVTGLGVATVAGEFSNTYSVRGGNFDENLVYVNDFEIYRPFLIRSGQQEGLSFVNASLTSNLTFSSGGFQPRYGDKMASVLNAQYKVPKKFGGSFALGLLGGTVHLEGIIKGKKDSIPRVTYLFGVRQKSNQYLLNSLETKGQYSPSFVDIQSFVTFRVNKRNSLEWIVNYARNRFVFLPEDRSTTFGVVNQVLRLNIYFEGQEDDRYKTLMSGLAWVTKPNKSLMLKWMTSVYHSVETETFDILAEYYLGEVENDLGEEDFGQVKYNLGVGGLQNFARNRFEANIFNFEHRGTYKKMAHLLDWGLRYQREILDDQLNEWDILDSAGYSLPYDGQSVQLDRVLKTQFDLGSDRYSGYFQDSWRLSEPLGITFTYGGRFTYWSVNKELVISPRMQFSFKPVRWNKEGKNVIFTASAGMYAQPPFYREMRNLNGVVNTKLKSQKSIHAIVGANYDFTLWKRKFSFISEVYYKYLYDLVPYEFENVLIRYYGENRAKGYAAGVDFRLNGEFVKGTDSYINLSIMSTKENLEDDYYRFYLNANGVEVPAGSDSITQTGTRYPGSVPRPTDQRVNFSMFFQDYIPKYDYLKMHLNLVFATGLPFGPPDNQRYGDTLRIPPYRRVDIGFSALLFSKIKKEEKQKEIKPFMRNVNSIWATLEIYNLLGVNNTVSYLWIRDVSETVYAVPNNLSARRFNIRLVCTF